MSKKTSFAGSFYPNEKAELTRYFDYFDEIYNQNFTHHNDKPRIIIAPHAGYVYSGFTASTAYKALANSKPKTVVVIAPSHRVMFNGFSICDYTQYKTPLGDLESDLDLIRSIKEKFNSSCVEKAHIEHSSEVQLPFIKRYINGAKAIEIIYSNIDPDDLEKLIAFILEDSGNSVVISSDLSHFYNEKTANQLDSYCIKAVEDLDVDLINNPCEACGGKGIAAAINYAKKMSLKSKVVDYRTSGDVTDDKTSVVGYMSGYIY